MAIQGRPMSLVLAAIERHMQKQLPVSDR